MGFVLCTWPASVSQLVFQRGPGPQWPKKDAVCRRQLAAREYSFGFGARRIPLCPCAACGRAGVLDSATPQLRRQTPGAKRFVKWIHMPMSFSHTAKHGDFEMCDLKSETHKKWFPFSIQLKKGGLKSYKAHVGVSFLAHFQVGFHIGPHFAPYVELTP